MQNKYQEEFKRRQLRQCQLKQLAILEIIDEICNKHGIEYWLDGGTLLGAVRHKGFIPWDDDIDIAMRNEDLPRFVEIAKSELQEPLCIYDPKESAAKKPIVKVFDKKSFYVEGGDDLSDDTHKCVYVDIFPFIDYPTVSRSFAKRVFKQYSRSYSILHSQHYYSCRSVAELFWFGAKLLINRIAISIAFLCCKKGRYISNILRNNGYGIMHEKRSVFPLGSITFEGKQFSAPANPDAYLRDLYGDYMQIPPEEKRVIHSVFIMSELI